MMKKITEATVIKVGNNTLQTAYSLYNADDSLKDHPFKPEHKQQYDALVKILVRCKKKFNLFREIECDNGDVVFIVGIGSEPKTTFAWFVEETGKTSTNQIVTSNYLSNTSKFLELPEEQQDLIVRGKLQEVKYAAGDIVKFDRFNNGEVLVGAIVDVTKTKDGIIYRIQDLPHDNIPVRVFFNFIKSFNILGKASAAEIAQASKPRTFSSLPKRDKIIDSVGDLAVRGKRLISLKGCPTKVPEDFDVTHNFLATLEGGPKIVGGDYICNNNVLTTFDGVAEEATNYHFDDNKITSLTNIHHHIKRCKKLFILKNPIESGWLYVFLIKGIEDFTFDAPDEVEEIFSKYIPMGKAGLIKCQMELINAGFHKYARM